MPFAKQDNLIDWVRQGRLKQDNSAELKMRRDEIYQGTLIHPWAFLSAKDVDDSPLVRTMDTKEGKPRPFPCEYEYLRPIVYEVYDPDNFMVVMRKTRQILASFTILLTNGFWSCMKYPNSEVLISRNKEEGSIQLMRQKILHTWDLLPAWYKSLVVLKNKPRDRLQFNNGSHIIGVNQNFYNSDSRGDSASKVIVDEADYQAQLPNIITAVLPMTGQLTMMSSTSAQGEGSRTMEIYEKRAKEYCTSQYSPCDGVTIFKAKLPESAKTLCLIEAFPEEMKQKETAFFYVNKSAYEQEMSGSRDAVVGRPYFPEFDTYGGVEFYHNKVLSLPKGTVIHRGFDFGFKRPACTWATVDKTTHQMHVLFDLLGEEIDPWSFAGLVRYLSGEIPREQAEQSEIAKDVIERLYETGRPGPWLENDPAHPIVFKDHAGHEAKITINSGPGKKPQTFAAIFKDQGIEVMPKYWNKDRRELVIRHLLKPRKDLDGRPSLEIDCENAPLVASGFLYGLVRPKNDKGKAEEPVHDDRYHDIYDSMGYIAIDEFDDTDFEKMEFNAPEEMTRNAPDSPVDVDTNQMSRYAAENDIDRLWGYGR